MKVDEYKLLVTIRNVGTIRGAAKELLISQPAISQRLKQIEDHWGEKLFLRTHKNIIVTPVGEKVIEFGEEMIKGEERLIDEVSKVSKNVNGRLSLGVSSVVGQYILPRILEDYINKYRDVKIELVTGLSETIRSSIANFHLTIIRGEKVTGLKCIELFSDRLFLIYKKNKETTEKLLIEFQSDPSFHSIVDNWLIEHPKIKFLRKMKVDQIETCKQLMAHGIGLAILPESVVEDLDPEQYTLEPLVVNNQYLSRPTWLCYPEVAEELPQVKAFLDVVQSHFACN
jgi:DNA-binding transcriptional LysR family regulator